MKKIIFIFLICSYSFNYSQSQIIGEIKYTQTTNFFRPFTETYVLKFDNKNSFYEEINIKASSSKNLNESSQNSLNETIIIGRKNLKSKWYYTNNDDVFFRDNYYNKTLLVKDDNIKLNWKLLDEVKELGGFLCQKAEVTFRGRSYVAWYTKEIPYAFGPWKFNGLPGLILQIKEKENVFYISATVVKLKKSKTNDVLEFDKSILKKAMTLDKYNAEKIKLVKEDFARMSSKQPKGSKPIIFNEKCKDCRDILEYFN